MVGVTVSKVIYGLRCALCVVVLSWCMCGVVYASQVHRYIKQLDAKSRVRRVMAMESLVHLGYQAVPSLRRALRHPVRRVRISAATALGRIGRRASSAVGELRRLLRGRDWLAQSRAAEALGKMGSPARVVIPDLFRLLQGRNRRVKLSVIRALGRLKARSQRVILSLSTCVGHRSASIRRGAVKALGRTHVRNRIVRQALLKALVDRDRRVGVAAARELGRFRAGGRFALKRLLQVAKDLEQYGRVRGAALDAIARIDLSYFRGRLGVLRLGLRDASIHVRAASASVLGQMRATSKEHVGPLRRLLRDRSVKVRLSAVSALSKMGKKAVPTLVSACKSRVPSIQLEAIEALGEMRGRAAVAVQPLSQLLLSPNRRIRRAASHALVQIGRPSVSALLKILRHPSAYAKRAAIGTLRKLGRSAERSIPDLVQLLADRQVGAVAARALARFGRKARVVLLLALQHRNASVRSSAVDALSLQLQRVRSRRVRRVIVNAFLRRLGDRVASVRWVAAEAIGQCKPLPQRALPKLMRALRDRDRDVRAAVVETIGKYKGRAAPAVPALRKMLRDRDKEVKVRVIRSLGKIGLHTWSNTIVRLLLKELRSPDAHIRRATILALGDMKKRASAAIFLLRKRCRDREVEVRLEARRVLHMLRR